MKPVLKIVGAIVFLCSLLTTGYAQITAFTSDGRKVLLSMDGTWKYVFENDGKKVILNPDGTWKYAVAKDSSAMVTAKVIRDSTAVAVRDSVKIAPVKPVIKRPPPNLDCSALVGIERDLTSDSWAGESRRIVISEDSKTGFSIAWMNTKKGPVTWMTTLLGKGQCIDETNKMIIVLKDGLRLQLVNDGKSNCDGIFKLNFTGIFGKESSLETFKKTLISSIRLYTSKGYVDEEFAEEDALRFRAALNCLAK